MEEIIYQYLCEQLNTEEGLLTSYMGVPAVFNSKAPDDKDEGWDEKSQFPRVVFDLNMQADPERKISGQLLIDVMCENTEESVQVEDIEAVIKGAVDGCFFSNSELTISAQWESSNDFEQGNDDKIVGTTIAFDILAYPNQLTESPDPIAATNLWVKTLYSNAIVIGKDTLNSTWKATDESPAIYCSLFRLTDSAKMKSNYSVDWFDAEIHINVIAPTDNIRSMMCKNIIQTLRHATRIMLDDGSPMLIDKVTENLTADPLRNGQIIINGTYGVITKKSGIKLQHTYICRK